mgnify:CR=1 FL=1
MEINCRRVLKGETFPHQYRSWINENSAPSLNYPNHKFPTPRGEKCKIFCISHRLQLASLTQIVKYACMQKPYFSNYLINHPQVENKDDKVQKAVPAKTATFQSHILIFQPPQCASFKIETHELLVTRIKGIFHHLSLGTFSFFITHTSILPQLSCLLFVKRRTI